MQSLPVAVLDMYDGAPNEGMRCIRQLLRKVEQETGVRLADQTFDVRGGHPLPGLEFDLYISTGGPGSPLPTDAPWERQYFGLIDRIFDHNRTQRRKKYLFLICHSFQLVSRHLGLGILSKRRSTSFGVFPILKNELGHHEPFFEGLPDPFYVVDSREYQLTQPNWKRLEHLGARVLCLEKARPHVPLERAIMAIRFTNEVFGTQFHPEADADGMLRYFQNEEKKQQVIAGHGEEKYNEMVGHLRDPDTIERTEAVILPGFLRQAIRRLVPVEPFIERG